MSSPKSIPANQVIIFDTTLRDGEQSPGATMNLAEKLEVAQALADLGVNVIEAGFPAASQGDFDSVRAVAQRVDGASVCGLARCTPDDITKAWHALKDAQVPRIHVFLATSPIHREHKLKKTKAEVLAVFPNQREFLHGWVLLGDPDVFLPR